MQINGKVIIANEKDHSQQLENLRWTSYHNSESFTVADDEIFNKYCKWTEKDSSGIVLLVLDNNNNLLSTMRGNVYYNQPELEAVDINFKSNSDGFLNFPVLNMTFAATSPTVFKSGLNSVLRYYFYVLHRHCVKQILGTGIFNSSIYKTLERLNYEFRFIEDLRTDLLGVDKKFIARLDQQKFDFAIKSVSEKYCDIIRQYPLIVD